MQTIAQRKELDYKTTRHGFYALQRTKNVTKGSLRGRAPFPGPIFFIILLQSDPPKSFTVLANAMCIITCGFRAIYASSDSIQKTQPRDLKY